MERREAARRALLFQRRSSPVPPLFVAQKHEKSLASQAVPLERQNPQAHNLKCAVVRSVPVPFLNSRGETDRRCCNPPPAPAIANALRFHIAHGPLRHHARAQRWPVRRPPIREALRPRPVASLCAGASPTIGRSPSRPRELRLAWGLRPSLPLAWAVCEQSKSIGSGQWRL